MTAQEFVIWLNGFLEAISTIENHHLLKIKSKLSEVKENYIDYTKNKPFDVTPYTKIGEGTTIVTYSDICSCNPKNGGSGICGCVIANKEVNKVPFYYSSTSTYSPNNKENKPILNG